MEHGDVESFHNLNLQFNSQFPLEYVGIGYVHHLFADEVLEEYPDDYYIDTKISNYGRALVNKDKKHYCRILSYHCNGVTSNRKFLFSDFLMKKDDEILLEKDGASLIFTKQNNDKAKYDFSTKKYYSKTRRSKKWREVKNLRTFFRNYRINQLKSNDLKYNMFLQILAKMKTTYKNISRFIEIIPEFSNLEKLCMTEGLIVQYNGELMNSYDNGGYWANRHLLYYDEYPKIFLKFLIKNQIPLSVNIVQNYIGPIDEFDIESMNILDLCLKDEDFNNDFIEVIHIELLSKQFPNYTLQDIYEMIKTFNLNIKSFVRYLRYLMTFEGLVPEKSLHYYNDYLVMSDVIKTKYDKYPKMLLSVENIITVLYQQRKQEYDEIRFINAISLYKNLSFATDDYSIIIPKNPNHLIEEGRELCHCVGSYVDKIINRKTRIVFLRENNNIDVPFVTIEVHNNNSVGQISAKYNSKPKDEVFDFIDLWKKKRFLE